MANPYIPFFIFRRHKDEQISVFWLHPIELWSLPKRGFLVIPHCDESGGIEDLYIQRPTRNKGFPFQSIFCGILLAMANSKRSALANLSMLRTLRPPRFFGRHTMARLTLHCPPVVLPEADHRNVLSNLFIFSMVAGCTLRGFKC
jgi:hypothetical protein